MKHTPSVFALLAIAAIPIAATLDISFTNAWNSRLAFPDYLYTIPFHTRTVSNGSVIPPVISSDVSYTPKDNPIILFGQVIVSPQATISFAPGTHVFANEYSQIIVEGDINSLGTEEKEVIFTTNEEHPANMVWGGIVLAKGATGTITHTAISYASPGISCLDESEGRISHTNISYTNLGAYFVHNNCTIKGGLVHSARDGVFAPEGAVLSSYPPRIVASRQERGYPK